MIDDEKLQIYTPEYYFWQIEKDRWRRTFQMNTDITFILINTLFDNLAAGRIIE